jgi:streptomycin 6-kinase
MCFKLPHSQMFLPLCSLSSRMVAVGSRVTIGARSRPRGVIQLRRGDELGEVVELLAVFALLVGVRPVALGLGVGVRAENRRHRETGGRPAAGVLESASMSQAHCRAFTVPATFRDALVKDQGDRAREWFDRLPGLVTDLLERWSCVITAPTMSGWAGVVVPVRRQDGSGAMLKVSPRYENPQFEATTLATWAGRGAVLLLERDDANSAMLLEQLHPESLASVADTDEAMTIVGRLARRLAVPAPPGPPRLEPVFAQWAAELPAMSAAAGSPLPTRAVDAAIATCVELGPDQPDTMQHGDLNQTNVLRGTREDWLAIDPLGYVGEIAFECLTHLRDRWTELRNLSDPDRAVRRRIQIFADAAEIDVERALRWTQTRAVQTILRTGPFEGPMNDGGVHEWMATTLAD